MREAEVRLDGVGKRYGIRSPWVVRDVSLEILPGRLLRFEGRNGTGKSTVLRMIAGAMAPSCGSVSGRPVTGYVPERFPPALPFSARDYLSHVGRIHGLADKDLAARVDTCLDRLGGREFADVPLRTMSKGMCQKVAVAQALLPGSGLLVLDEAWTGLDTQARTVLDDTVAARLAGGGAVVFVDHDPGRLAHLNAQRWRIEHGRAQLVATDGGRTQADAEGDRPGAPGEGPEPAFEIEITGLLGDAARCAELPSVRSAVWDGERLRMRVARDRSDQVLRALLATGPDVHVVGVRRATGEER